MAEEETKVTKKASPKVDGLKITISHDQKVITSEPVKLNADDMVLIMPKYNCMTFKRKLYWFANILYKYWK